MIRADIDSVTETSFCVLRALAGSSVAGLVFPLWASIAGVLAGPVLATNVIGFLFVSALLIAGVTFLAWLGPTPEELRSPAYDRPVEE